MQNDQPYHHPAIESIIRHIFFHGSSAATYDGIYCSSIPGSDELEVPIAMVALAATAVSANPNSWWSGLKYDRCMLQLTTGAVTEVRFPQVSMKISTTATLQHLRVLRRLTFVLSMQLLDQSIVIVCECFHPLWNNVSVNQAQQEEFRGPAHSPTSHPRHGRAVYLPRLATTSLLLSLRSPFIPHTRIFLPIVSR